MWSCCGNVTSVPTAPFITVILAFLFFGHACPKLNFVFISGLTGKRLEQNNKKRGHNVDIILCTYEGDKIKM